MIDIPTEQTTALTDLIMGLVVASAFLSLYRLRSRTRTPKLTIWLYAFGFLGFTAFAGTIAHGLAMSPELNFWLWQPIYLALGLAVAMFALATVFDIWGERMVRKVRLPMLGVAVVFYLITLLGSGSFLTFIIYEALAMLFALCGYFYLAIRSKLKGAWWMVAGILITIIAAVIQASGENGVAIFWGLDHNGVFHLVQLFGVLALWFGLQKSPVNDTGVPQQAAI